jgi:L-rhamnose isomerase
MRRGKALEVTGSESDAFGTLAIFIVGAEKYIVGAEKYSVKYRRSRQIQCIDGKSKALQNTVYR